MPDRTYLLGVLNRSTPYISIGRRFNESSNSDASLNQSLVSFLSRILTYLDYLCMNSYLESGIDPTNSWHWPCISCSAPHPWARCTAAITDRPTDKLIITLFFIAVPSWRWRADICLPSFTNSCNDGRGRSLGCGAAHQQLPRSPITEILWTCWNLLTWTAPSRGALDE